MGIAIIFFYFLTFSDITNAHTIIAIAKYMTATESNANAILPAIIGPTTAAIDKVELKIPTDVERGLFSIR